MTTPGSRVFNMVSLCLPPTAVKIRMMDGLSVVGTIISESQIICRISTNRGLPRDWGQDICVAGPTRGVLELRGARGRRATTVEVTSSFGSHSMVPRGQHGLDREIMPSRISVS